MINDPHSFNQADVGTCWIAWSEVLVRVVLDVLFSFYLGGKLYPPPTIETRSGKAHRIGGIHSREVQLEGLP